MWDVRNNAIHPDMDVPGFAVIGHPMASWIVTIVLLSLWLTRKLPPLKVPTSSTVALAPVNCAGVGVLAGSLPMALSTEGCRGYMAVYAGVTPGGGGGGAV